MMTVMIQYTKTIPDIRLMDTPVKQMRQVAETVKGNLQTVLDSMR